MREMLIEGNIEPGAKLNERELSLRLHVVFEMLARLEARSGELAAQRITAAQLSEIRALHYEMLVCFARDDLSGYHRLNARIHLASNDAAGNPLLMKTYKEINARVQALRFRTNQNRSRWQDAVREHEAMLQALETRDASAMRRILTQHLLHKRDTVIELLRSGSANGSVRSPSLA